MDPFIRHTGIAAPLVRGDVDTDQIVPKQFLKRVERSGYGRFLFHDWRFGPDGSPDPGFVLNLRRYRDASVLVAGPNFGCGSSREHAVWALQDYGFRAVLAPSFADIFRQNCLSAGLLPVTLPAAAISHLQRRAAAPEGYRLTVDLEAREVADEEGFRASFPIDEWARHRLLNGLDDIGLTLQLGDAIDRYERSIEGRASAGRAL